MEMTGIWLDSLLETHRLAYALLADAHSRTCRARTRTHTDTCLETNVCTDSETIAIITQVMLTNTAMHTEEKGNCRDA